tara:strand:+ start:159 stop:377 length:219 start_codon:yes stop_codon:yes gene_type:complete
MNEDTNRLGPWKWNPRIDGYRLLYSGDQGPDERIRDEAHFHRVWFEVRSHPGLERVEWLDMFGLVVDVKRRF